MLTFYQQSTRAIIQIHRNLNIFLTLLNFSILPSPHWKNMFHQISRLDELLIDPLNDAAAHFCPLLMCGLSPSAKAKRSLHGWVGVGCDFQRRPSAQRIFRSCKQHMLQNVDNRAGKHAPSLSELTCRDTLPAVLHLGQGYATARG